MSWNDDPRNGFGQSQLAQVSQQQGLLGGGLGQPEREMPPRDAAGLIAIAERRIAEIDRELARATGLKTERERLAAIVATKEPSGAT